MARGQQVTDAFFERKLVEVRLRLGALCPRANPVASPQVHMAARAGQIRQLHCGRYNACLDVAFAARWEGFSCERCEAFQPMSAEERIADLESLIDLLGAVAHGAA